MWSSKSWSIGLLDGRNGPVNSATWLLVTALVITADQFDEEYSAEASLRLTLLIRSVSDF